jgi:hypothetical protein
MLRKNLGSPDDFSALPSLLGHYFRLTYYGSDPFDYSRLLPGRISEEERLQIWNNCKHKFGIFYTPNRDRQQYVN